MIPISNVEMQRGQIGVAISDGALKIERGVPIPPSAPRGREVVLPLAQMQVNDSVLIPLGYLGRSDPRILKVWVNYQFTKFRKRDQPEWGFTSKTSSLGVRVWRTK